MMEVQNFHQAKNFYQWTVHEYELPPEPFRHQSPVFKFCGRKSDWVLIITSSQVKPGHIIVLLRSIDLQERLEGLDFFVNNLRVPEPDVSFGKFGERTISVFDSKTFFIHGSQARGMCGTITVKSSDYIVNEDLSNALGRDFGLLLNDAKFSDFVIVTEDGSQLPVHRNVLSVRSSVFRAMLDNNMAEKHSGCLQIDDLSTEIVKDMIDYLYTGRLRKFSFDSASELFRAADKYDLKELKQVCRDHLSTNLSAENAAQVLLLADTYREDSLKKKVLEFISKNQSSFTNPQLFEGLLKRPGLLVDIINSNAKSYNESNTQPTTTGSSFTFGIPF